MSGLTFVNPPPVFTYKISPAVNSDVLTSGNTPDTTHTPCALFAVVDFNNPSIGEVVAGIAFPTVVKSSPEL